jgi:hypothetical protein
VKKKSEVPVDEEDEESEQEYSEYETSPDPTARPDRPNVATKSERNTGRENSSSGGGGT